MTDPLHRHALVLEAPLDEEWRPVEGYPGYQVSSLGRVLGARGRTLRGNRIRGGYLLVRVYGSGRAIDRLIHRLVAHAFIGPCPPGSEVRHRDGNPANNDVSNLEYATRGRPVTPERWCAACHGYHPHSEFGPQNTSRDGLRSTCRKSRRIVRKTVPQRFWAKVNKSGPLPAYRPSLGGCWLWTGSGKPYGAFAISRLRRIGAHRYAYQQLRGPVGDGLVLDHLCRVTACVNPDHLEPVTQSENVRRGFRWRKPSTLPTLTEHHAEAGVA